VSGRNVLLTGSVWRGGIRNISHDAKRRDRLVALKKARKGLITQRQAAEELGQSERHVRRLLKRLKGKGDGGLVHALRGRQLNRKLDEKTKQKALEILGREVYRGFGPTLAAEYLAGKHDIHARRETVRG
jgi:transposase